MILTTILDGETVGLSIIGLLLAILGFFLRHWFKKTNEGYDTIIDGLGDNRVTLAKQEIATAALKEYNEDSQKRIFREIHTLSKSMNNSLEKVIEKTEKNTTDIANLKSANMFISKEIKDLKRGKGQ
jgi:ribosomal protein L22